MYLLNLTTQILREMWQHKLRSALAVFCIAWGTLTVILLLALGDGFHDATRASIMRVAENAFFVIPSQTSKSYMGYPKGQPINIKAQAVVDLPKNLESIHYASPLFVIHGDKVSFKKRQFGVQLAAVSDSFIKIRALDMVPKSRFLNKLDINRARRVTILGAKVKKELFGDEDALGKEVMLHGIGFKVVGVLQQFPLSGHAQYNNQAIIPYTTFITFMGDRNINFFIALPNLDINPDIAETSVRNYFARIYKFDPTDTTGFKVFNTIRMYRFFNWFFIGIKLFLIIGGALTLGVGALGVANIMFLIVTERTNEIGLRMAIGASYWYILLQIICEAMIIVILGGLLGFFVASTTIAVLQYVPLPAWLGKPSLTLSSFVISIITLAILGIAAGFFPARRAALLDPITALRD